jgi:hypothetical protein
MSSLLDSKVAAQASNVEGSVTSGAIARVHDPTAMSPAEVITVSNGPKYSGGRRKRRTSQKAKKSKARKSKKSRRSSRARRYRRPLFLL